MCQLDDIFQLHLLTKWFIVADLFNFIIIVVIHLKIWKSLQDSHVYAANVVFLMMGETNVTYPGVQRSRAALQRYLFYCNRYMNHMQSLRFEHKLYAQVKQKMEEMQQHNMSWIEVQFLKKAVDVLCQCRSTLMFTYVFAFYLKKNNQSIIFEVWQQENDGLKCH